MTNDDRWYITSCWPGCAYGRWFACPPLRWHGVAGKHADTWDEAMEYVRGEIRKATRS